MGNARKTVGLRLVIHEVYTMPKRLYDQCLKLNWGDEETMLGKLRECRETMGTGYGILAVRGRDRICGWSLVTPKTEHRLATASFYVSPKYRGRRLGVWLVMAARDIISPLGLRMGFFGHSGAIDFFRTCRDCGALPATAENQCEGFE